MAGAGVRLFTAGQILTASQVNTYLMDQVIAVFPDSGSRDAAFGGLGEPALADGRFCYLQSDHKLYFYNHDSLTWEEVGAQVSDGEITAIKLDASAVTEAKIATDAVTTNKIANLAVTTAKIDTNAVTAGKLGADAVTTTKIIDGAVTSAKIADGTIVDADINATAGIALTKLASGSSAQVVIGNSSGVPTYTTVSGDATITNAGVVTISSTAVSAGKIASDAVTTAKIQNDAVTTAKIADSNVTYAKLASAAITTLNTVAYNSIRNTPTITANAYTLTLSDLGKLVELNNSTTAMTLYVPDNSVAFNVGDRIDILQTMAGVNMITVAGANGTVTVNSFDNQLKLGGQWASATLIKRASTSGGVWVLIGNITS